MMIALALTLALSTTPAADKYGIAVLSSKTGNILASAVLIHPHAALTAAHAVDALGQVVPLRCDGSTVHGIVTRLTVLLDLAVIEFDEECGSTVAEISASNAPIGTALTVVGFPGGRYLMVTRGIASSYDIIQAEFPRYSLLTDAIIFAGNSGGPVLTDDGALVGIIVGQVCMEEKGRTPACYGSAVPVSLIKLFLRSSP